MIWQDGNCPLRPLSFISHAVRVVFGQVIDDGLEELGARTNSRGGVARVDGGNRSALVIFRPDGLEVLVAERLAVVGREERNAIGL